MIRNGLAILSLILAASADDPAPPERFSAEQRDHWAFRSPVRPEVPDVADPRWPRNPIDRFLLADLETVELRPSPEADRVALIRRLSFDLTGLPPKPEEVAGFLADDRPDAYDWVVDRLLASPAYGVRWAQHWLDLAHYADSNGFELDAERPDAWRYRDWVVRALNEDMPYDRFLRLQVAGDEAEPGNDDALIATGFARSGPREVVGGNIDAKVRRQSELTEVTGTVGSVVLGLTMACARCHDHKFDPIPTTDYYRLQSYFAAAEFAELPIATKAEEAAYNEAKAAVDAAKKPAQKELADLEAPYRKALRQAKDALLTEVERAVLAKPKAERTPAEAKIAEGAAVSLKVPWEEVAEAVAAVPADHERREGLKRRLFELDQSLPRPPARAMALVDRQAEAPATQVYRRGEVTNLGPEVVPRPPGILIPEGEACGPIEPREATTGRRLALARWLTTPENPLVARVIVNRLWQHHFGRGIVATPSDFGIRGEYPTNPALLDWLAAELVDQGWRLKAIHRLMVTSATYRQASDTRQGRETDPSNTQLWRMNRRRLDAEAIRDAMLAASGDLNPSTGGPGVRPPIEPEVEALIFTEEEAVDLWPETPDPTEHLRRSLYLFRKRNVRYPMFDAFDAPDSQTPCPVRSVSTHAPQALALMNGRFAIDRARGLAGLILEAGSDGALDRLYLRVLSRSPTAEEADRDRDFLRDQAGRLSGRSRDDLVLPAAFPDALSPAEAAAWVDLALAMLNRNEFLFIP